MRLYASAAIYWHKDDLSALSGWAESVLAAATECILPSHPAAPPLLEGLLRVPVRKAYEAMARAMPEGSGIKADHVANYADRFSRREGLPGHTADCDCGEWKKKFHAAPRVLACPAASRYS